MRIYDEASHARVAFIMRFAIKRRREIKNVQELPIVLFFRRSGDEFGPGRYYVGIKQISSIM
jgi:hypothetical protein